MAEKITRREVMKRAAYIAPAILTLTAMPAFAQGGSGYQHDSKDKSERHRSPPRRSGFVENLIKWLKSLV
jgi:hypothetical protein